METDVRKYLDLKVDELKLKTIDGLSVGVGKVLSLMTVLMLAYGNRLRCLGRWFRNVN